MPFASTTMTLDDVEVECTHCGIRMTTHLGSSNRVRYFRCASCHRWVSSVYTEVFSADTKVRTHKIVEEKKEPQFEEVKVRLERWLQALDDQDPYRTLGVSPLDSADTIRARYRELAMAHHPDRGGSAAKMRELNLAYERIIHHRERRKAEALSSGSTTVSLPEASR